MASINLLQRIYWCHFAKPQQERALFRHLLASSVRSVLEIGVGDGARMRRIAKLIHKPADCEKVRYIGVDEFESAQDAARHLTLKQAHQLASQLSFKASLIPGDLKGAMPRVAHKFGASDLIIVNGGLDAAQPADGLIAPWLDRLAHDRSVILTAGEWGGELIRLNNQLIELPVKVAA